MGNGDAKAKVSLSPYDQLPITNYPLPIASKIGLEIQLTPTLS